MPRHVASPELGHGSWSISAVDADGMGTRLLSLTHDRQAPRQLAEDAARLLALAMSLPGGIKAATTLMRAELVRSE